MRSARMAENSTNPSGPSRATESGSSSDAGFAADAYSPKDPVKSGPDAADDGDDGDGDDHKKDGAGDDKSPWPDLHACRRDGAAVHSAPPVPPGWNTESLDSNPKHAAASAAKASTVALTDNPGPADSGSVRIDTSDSVFELLPSAHNSGGVSETKRGVCVCVYVSSLLL